MDRFGIGCIGVRALLLALVFSVMAISVPVPAESTSAMGMLPFMPARIGIVTLPLLFVVLGILAVILVVRAIARASGREEGKFEDNDLNALQSIQRGLPDLRGRIESLETILTANRSGRD
jgi:hypothetical protein